MLTPALYAVILVQMALGAFDILYHHELTERLAWRPSQRRELWLHAVRNLVYAAAFTILAAFEPRGLWAWALAAALVGEILITLVDFVEEDNSRRLPATERVTHTLLAINYGVLLALLLPRLITLGLETSAIAIAWRGWFGAVALVAAVGCVVFAARELAASRRAPRLIPQPAAPLAAALGERRRILVTGATGFIGRRLVQALVAGGHDVIALVRTPAKIADLAPLRIVTDLNQIAGDECIDAIVNLAGEPISDGFWTLAKRRRILRSRLAVTRDVRRLIARLKETPPVLVNGSAIGWYGLRGDEVLDEDAAPSRVCFSHRLCAAWEKAAMACAPLGVRVVALRIGLVLGADGGPLSRLLTPFEFGLGGPMGKGNQWMSWIALDDLVRLIVLAIADDRLAGPVNATAPEPVTSREFARTLGRVLHRPALLAAPAAPLRLALGDFAHELLLSGQRVVPANAVATGYRFQYPRLAQALRAIVGQSPVAPGEAAYLMARKPSKQMYLEMVI